MYETPRLERFGTFRELTTVGSLGDSDGFPVLGNAGRDVATCERAGGVITCTPTDNGSPGPGRS